MLTFAASYTAELKDRAVQDTPFCTASLQSSMMWNFLLGRGSSIKTRNRRSLVKPIYHLIL